MTEKRPEYGVQVSAWRMGPRKVVLDWRTIQVGWMSTPAAPTAHTRVILDYTQPLTPAHLTVLVGRMCQYMLRKKGWRCQLPTGMPFHEVGDAVASVPPSGGEGGENPQLILPGQEPLPGIDEPATIDSPPPSDRQGSVSEPKARRRRTAVDRGE